MKKFYLRTKGDERNVQYYRVGNGWWSRRKDEAKAFDTREDAVKEMQTAVVIEERVELEEPEHAVAL